jgi:hypothetical protein
MVGGLFFFFFFLMNYNFIERKRAEPSYMKSIQKSQSPYRLLQSKKLTKSTRFDEEKFGTYTIAQPKRDLKKEDFKESMLDL